jgi:predicted DNA-binding antitoxin AbrB/MazE fold protein
MSIAVEAVWEHGVLTPKTRVDLPEKTSVRIVIEEAPKSRTAMGADLRAIRARIVATGVPLLTKEEVLEEVHSRRGGYSEAESRE